MKKVTIQLITLLSISVMSVSAFAGGTFGGNPGDISKNRDLLESKWNGKAGNQNTVSNGVIVQWNADVCGTMNGKETDPSKCDANNAKSSD